MKSPFEIVNPLNLPGWDEAVCNHSDAMIFHSAVWARVLIESYGFTPLYHVVRDGGAIPVLQPLMEVRSPITGKRGVSLPFSDECAPLGFTPDLFDHLVDVIEDYGKQEGWKYVEMRGAVFPKPPRSSVEFYGHDLALDCELEQLYCRLKHSTRNSIKKAERSDVEVRTGSEPAAIREFYDLNCLTRKRHGLPPQPKRFFTVLLKHILAQGYGRVFTAAVAGTPVASSICLEFNNTAIIKYAAFDTMYQTLRPNNLMVWEIMKHYKEHGFNMLMFGRTEMGNPGLRQFKHGWGLEEKMIRYYKLDVQRSIFLQEGDRLVRTLNGVFRRTPLPVLKGFGRLMYRHAG